MICECVLDGVMGICNGDNKSIDVSTNAAVRKFTVGTISLYLSHICLRRSINSRLVFRRFSLSFLISILP